MTDYVDDWGGDLNDPKQRCRHGTFIGSWAGPDYLCGWCESGDEPEGSDPETCPVCGQPDNCGDCTHERGF